VVIYLFLIAITQTIVSEKERIAFQLAIERFANVHAISSHLVIGALIIFANNSFEERLPIFSEVQVVGPDHHFCSIPLWYRPKPLVKKVENMPKIINLKSGLISHNTPANMAIT